MRQEKSEKILGDVQVLQNAMTMIKNSMEEMTQGTKAINSTTSALSDVSGKMKANISEIGEHINQFNV